MYFFYDYFIIRFFVIGHSLFDRASALLHEYFMREREREKKQEARRSVMGFQYSPL